MSTKTKREAQRNWERSVMPPNESNSPAASRGAVYSIEIVRTLHPNEIMTAEWLQSVAHAFPNHFGYHNTGCMTARGDFAQCKSILRHYIRSNTKAHL